MHLPIFSREYQKWVRGAGGGEARPLNDFDFE